MPSNVADQRANSEATQNLLPLRVERLPPPHDLLTIVPVTLRVTHLPTDMCRVDRNLLPAPAQGGCGVQDVALDIGLYGELRYLANLL